MARSRAKQQRTDLHAPYTSAALEVLADGVWHRFDEICRAATPLVRIELAARVYVMNGVRANPSRALARLRQDYDGKIELGRRQVIRKMLDGLIGCEKRGRRGEPEYRVRRLHLVVPA